MRELSEVKDSLDMEVKQNFIDPLQNLHDKDLREIQVCVISLLRHTHSLTLQTALSGLHSTGHMNSQQLHKTKEVETEGLSVHSTTPEHCISSSVFNFLVK